MVGLLTKNHKPNPPSSSPSLGPKISLDCKEDAMSTPQCSFMDQALAERKEVRRSQVGWIASQASSGDFTLLSCFDAGAAYWDAMILLESIVLGGF